MGKVKTRNHKRDSTTPPTKSGIFPRRQTQRPSSSRRKLSDDMFVVERILEERKYSMSGEVEYLVKWECYSAKDNTWEPAQHLEHCVEMLNEFNRKLLAKKNKSRPLENALGDTKESEKSTGAQRKSLKRGRELTERAVENNIGDEKKSRSVKKFSPRMTVGLRVPPKDLGIKAASRKRRGGSRR